MLLALFEFVFFHIQLFTDLVRPLGCPLNNMTHLLLLLTHLLLMLHSEQAFVGFSLFGGTTANHWGSASDAATCTDGADARARRDPQSHIQI